MSLLISFKGSRACGGPSRCRLAAIIVGYLTLFVTLAAVFGHFSMRLALDTDEPYYLLGGTLWARGKTIYRDFFYPQMPLTAIAFGTWQKIFGYGWVSGRRMCAVVSALIGLLVFHDIRREAGVRSGIIGLIFYCLSLDVLDWMGRLKSYGLTGLFCMLGLTALTHRKLSARRVCAAGLLTALAVAARLMALPLLGVLFLALLLHPDARYSRVRYTLFAAGGAVVGLIPVAYYWLRAPDAFMFNNLRYHAIRDGGQSLIADWAQKYGLMTQIIGGPRGDAQLTLLVPLSLAGLVVFARWGRQSIAYPLSVLALFVVSVLPTPTWNQYFSVLFPPAIVCCGLMFSRSREVVQWALLVPYAFVFWYSFESIQGSPTAAGGVVTLDKIGHALDEVTQADDRVAARTPQFLATTKREFTVCSFNVFAFGDWHKQLGSERDERYHLCTDESLAKNVISGTVRAFVASSDTELGLPQKFPTLGWTRHHLDVADIWVAPNHH